MSDHSRMVGKVNIEYIELNHFKKIIIYPQKIINFFNDPQPYFLTISADELAISMLDFLLYSVPIHLLDDILKYTDLVFKLNEFILQVH